MDSTRKYTVTTGAVLEVSVTHDGMLKLAVGGAGSATVSHALLFRFEVAEWLAHIEHVMAQNALPAARGRLWATG